MSGDSTPSSSLGISLPDINIPTLGELLGQKKPAPLESPDAISSTPTQAETNTTALQKQLAQESMFASTSTILTGGQGVLDTPTTTSAFLTSPQNSINRNKVGSVG